MAENKKISELTRVSSLTGAEIVPFAKDGSNGAVTTAKLKEYAQPDLSAITTALGGKVDKVTGKGLSANDYTDEDKAKLTALPNKSELDSSLGAKLDKSKWDAEHGQFTVVDKYINIEGRLASTEYARATEFICLNYKYDIKTDAKSRVDTLYVITFYDSAGKRIKGYRTQDLTYGEDGFASLTPSEFPTGAAYIRLSCYAAPYSGFTWSHGPSVESREGAVSEAIQASKLALFIDQWNAACGPFGKYNPANAPDAQHPFYLNTLWLTYAEAIKIAEQKPSWGTRQTDFLWRNIKTNIPQLIGAVASAYGNCFSNIEVVNLKYLSPTSMGTCFTGKDNKSVLNFNAYMLESASGCFKAPNLEVLEISNLKISLDLSKCPLINLASWQGLVTNAANTTPITITVHPDVYAKLTGDTTNAAAAALSADELAQWQSLVSAAAAKNISFATV